MLVKQAGPYRLYFHDHWDDEPPHAHVVGPNGDATFWLANVVLIETAGFAPGELDVISDLVNANQAELLALYEGL